MKKQKSKGLMTNSWKSLLIPILSLCFSLTVNSQNLTVSGTIKSTSGEPLIGVSVTVKGTSTGTVSNIDGKYAINAKQNSVLVFSYVGYKTMTLSATQSVMNVTMDEDSQLLNEVVAIGYGTVKKSDLTGSVSSVKSDAIARQPVANVAQALQGLASGVSVTSNSGSPGGSISIRIRGIGTVNDANPLFVVDQIPVSNVSYLNGNDIQSIEVLKDASATAIYGSRGANGVIIITTKQGTSGKDQIEYTSYWGVQSINTDLNLLNGQQWYDIQKEINKTRTTAINLANADPSISTNWLKELSQNASIQNYGLNFSGGDEKTTYSMGLNYLYQEGTVKKTDYERINARFAFDRKVNKLVSVGTNLNISTSNRNKILEGSNTVGIINSAIKLEPVVPVKNTDGSWGYSKYIDYPNPVAAIEYTNSSEKNLDVIGNIHASLQLAKGLKFKSILGMNFNRYDSYDFDPIYTVNNSQLNTVNKVYRGYIKTNNLLAENTLNFDRTFDKHSINAVVGFTAERTRIEDIYATKQNTPNDKPEMQYLSAAQLATSATATGSAIESSLISYLGRVNYTYNDRYLATATFRADGSSRFGKSNQYGYFPSFALAWKFTNEQFIKNLDLSWLNTGKLRLGWGQVGNQNIDNYMFQNLLTSTAQYAYLFGQPEKLYQGTVAVALGNSNVKWETTESTNIGLDLSLLKGKINLSAEYYNKTTKDMLILEPIPYFLGFETGPMTNVGSVENKGWEFTLEWRDKIGKDFNYSVGGNLTTIQNKVLSLGTGKAITGGAIRNGSATYTSVGYPIGAFWGYKTNGLINTADEYTDVRTRQPNADYGDVIFVDTNKDTKLTDLDKTMIGNPIPDFIYGFNLGMDFKGIDCNISFEGSQGNDIFNAMRYFTYSLADVTNKSVDVLDYYSATNTDGTMPRLNGNDKNDNLRISDRYVEDGSYLRLKNVQIGYTLPATLTNKIHINKFRLFVSGQNLLTFTKYSGADPEVGQISSGNFLSRGVDIGTYPQARVITGGINITF